MAEEEGKFDEILRNVPLLSALDKLADAVLIITNVGKVAYINKAAQKIYGVSFKEVVGEDASLLGEELGIDTSYCDSGGGSHFNRNSTRTISLLIKRNGDESWLDTTTSPLKDENGDQVGVMKVTRDVTEGKELQDERKYLAALKAEAKLAGWKTWNEIQKFFQQIHDPLFLLDGNLRFLYVNKSAKELLGRKGESLIGRRIEKALPRIGKTELYRQLILGNTGLTQKEFVESIGIWVEWSIQSWKSNANTNVGVYLRDINEEVMLESELLQSQLDYKQLVNSIHDPFFALDKRLRVTFWNEETEKITNILSRYALGKHVREVFPQASEEYQNEVYFSVLRTKVSQNFILTLTIGAEEHIFETNVYPSTKGVVILCRDVTESRRMQAELKRYGQQLEQIVEERTKSLRNAERLAAIGATAGMVGHDIRNPLQSILNEVYLAKNEVETIEQEEVKSSISETITNIEQDIHYINKIVADLQDYARPLNPNIRETKLKAAIEQSLRGSVVPKNIDVSVQIHPDDQPIYSDPDMLKRILSNLIVNAIQAMPMGGKLQLRTLSRKNSVLIEIQDTGAGISKEAQGKLFTPLFTTKSKGQGFGLAVVKRITEILCGKISFESEEGKGTTFTIELPRKIPE